MEVSKFKDPQPLTPEVSYLEHAWQEIMRLPQNALLFFDIEGTAIVYMGGQAFIRNDFSQLFRRVETERPDILRLALTYRSRQTGIPELDAFDFANVLYSENITELLESTPRYKLEAAVVSSLSTLHGVPNNDDTVERIMNGPWKKILYLMSMFQEVLPVTYLIDDGPDGEMAEQLGVGIKA